MRYLFLLFLAGCASTAPTQYNQSAYPVAPPAPTFNPAWDAPHTVGQPGYVGPAEHIPRSPHKRTLPETPATRREAGLWAGDQPRASIEPPEGFLVLDILIPYMSDTEFYGEREPTNRCGNQFYTVIKKEGLEARLRALGQKRLTCLLMQAYARCADDIFKKTKKNDFPAKTFTMRVRDHAAKEAKNACGDEPLASDDTSLIGLLAGGRP